MRRTMTAEVEQVGPSTSRGTVRTHAVTIDRPASKGGADQGPLGGELLLLSLGGCFMSNLLAAIGAREAPISDVHVSVEATLDGTPERMTAFALRVSARTGDVEILEKLVLVAKRACIVTNTLKDASPVTVSVEALAP